MNPNVAVDEKWIALLGKRNLPLDGVEDYCTFLAAALREHGTDLHQERVSWETLGWDEALAGLAAKSADWRGRWVLLQYTALAWSARGFPFQLLKVMSVLRRSGARVAVVFHEFSAQPGGRSLMQPIRRVCQNFVIRRLHDLADRSVFTVPLTTIPWLRASDSKASFIPIGANIPEPAGAVTKAAGSDWSEKTVAVFCFSEGPNRFREAEDIAFAVCQAQMHAGPLHLLLIGRGSEEMGTELSTRLGGTSVRVSVAGTLPAPEVANLLSQATVQLFVSGMVAQTRGSTLAGIACGLPIVGYEGAVEGTPLADGGLRLAPYRNAVALGQVLSDVLSDDELCRDLSARSRQVQKTWFSWQTISKRFVDVCHAAPHAASSPIAEPNSCLSAPETVAK